MKACIQRVAHAEVRVDGKICGKIGTGMLILLGVAFDDSPQDSEVLVSKIVGLRIFDDANGKMNLSLKDVQGEILVVSQFTLLADCRKGRRPSFTEAAPPEKAENFYENFVHRLQKEGISVQTGQFRAMMEVELVNDGPVTLWLDSRELLSR